MDTTTLYYAFSTIAQTLAAGFGVLAAFVLFRLQGVEKELERANAGFRDFSSHISSQEIRKVLKNGGYEALDKRLFEIDSKSTKGKFYSQGILKVAAETFLKNWPIWNRTRNRLGLALAVTVFDIVASLVAIPFAPALSRCPAYAWTTLAVSIVLAGVALSLYARLIWYLFNPVRLA